MKYMLLVYLDEREWHAKSAEEQQSLMAECAPHAERLKAAGKTLGGAPLHPTSTATTVELRNGKPLVTDGPFAETREQLGGYCLVEAEDLDDAIAIAQGFLSPRLRSRIEVRPVVELDRQQAV